MRPARRGDTLLWSPLCIHTVWTLSLASVIVLSRQMEHFLSRFSGSHSPLDSVHHYLLHFRHFISSIFIFHHHAKAKVPERSRFVDTDMFRFWFWFSRSHHFISGRPGEGALASLFCATLEKLNLFPRSAVKMFISLMSNSKSKFTQNQSRMTNLPFLDHRAYLRSRSSSHELLLEEVPKHIVSSNRDTRSTTPRTPPDVSEK